MLYVPVLELVLSKCLPLLFVQQAVDGAPALRHVTDNTLLTYITEQMWDPRPIKSHF
jgi:hypothetical protein